jgi:hypothetical protein
VLAIILSVFVVSQSYTYDVPLAVWSGKNYIKGQNVGVSDYVTSSEVEDMLRSFFKSESHSFLTQYVDTSKGSPEAVILFAEAQLRSEQLSIYASSLIQLKESIKHSESSLSAPFVDMPSAFDNNVANIAYHAKKSSGKVIYIGKGSALLHDIKRKSPETIEASYESLDNTFKRNSGIFSDGVTDLIVIYLPKMNANTEKFEESDKVIHRVNSIVTSLTQNYVCAYTALAYDNPEFNMEFGEKTIMTKRYVSYTLQGTNGTNNSNNTNGTSVPIFRQYFGGWFWELFVTLLVLIPLLITGTYAIDSIQTPLFDPKMNKKNN